MAVWSIGRLNVLSNYKIEVSFADGTTGVADLAPRLSQGPLGDGFDPLCDETVFAEVYLEHGALTWPGGIDLAPDANVPLSPVFCSITAERRPRPASCTSSSFDRSTTASSCSNSELATSAPQSGLDLVQASIFETEVLE
jgi:hypothetical protein